MLFYSRREKSRIPVVLNEIQRLWEMYPNLRLGQLLLSCCANEHVLFNIEDEELVKRLKEIVENKDKR